MIVVDQYLCSYAEPGPAEHESAAAWVAVVLRGELGFGSTGALDMLRETVRSHPGCHIVVDLSDVTFLDSTALVAFARAKAAARAGGGALSLLGASAHAHRLFEIWHLEPVPRRQPPGVDAGWASGNLPGPRVRTEDRDADTTPRAGGSVGP